MLEKIEGRRRRGWQRMKCLDSITNSMDQTPGDSEGQGKPAVLQSIGSLRVRHDLATEQQKHFCLALSVYSRASSPRTKALRAHVLRSMSLKDGIQPIPIHGFSETETRGVL